MSRFSALAVASVFVLLTSGRASSQIKGLDSLRLSGCGAMEMGQVVHGYYNNDILSHQWLEHFWGKLDATANTNDRTCLEFGFEVHYQYSVTTAFTYIPSFFPMIGVNLDMADIRYKLFDGAVPLTLQAGYFPFKYNPEAANLGEYLFRSGCYPTYVINNFDWAMSRVMGFNFENLLLKDNDLLSIKQNLLITSERKRIPTGMFLFPILLPSMR